MLHCQRPEVEQTTPVAFEISDAVSVARRGTALEPGWGWEIAQSMQDVHEKMFEYVCWVF